MPHSYSHESVPMEIGLLAREKGLAPLPDDWVEGWFWAWLGRSKDPKKIGEDFSSYEVVGNFSGHFVLQTSDNKLVAFGEDYGVQSQILLFKTQQAVLNRDYSFLNSVVVKGRLTTADASPAYALQASQPGIDIWKFKSVYSPSRLKFMLEHQSHVEYRCNYGWNVDIGKKKLNCCSYFQAWGITRDLPWQPKLSLCFQEMASRFEKVALSKDDVQLALSMLQPQAPLGSPHTSKIRTQLVNEAGQGILRITMDHPKTKNSFDNALYVDLAKCLEQAGLQDDIKCVVLTNAGDVFSSGADIVTGAPVKHVKQGIHMIHHEASRLLIAIISCPKLVVGVVNGPALGVSVAMLALCDMVYASERAWFWTPYFQYDLPLESGSSFTFPTVMGRSRAAQMLYMGKKMYAEESKTCGFVAEIYPSKELLKRVESELGSTVLKGPNSHKTIPMFKELLKSSYIDQLHWAIRREHEIQAKSYVEDHVVRKHFPKSNL